MMMKEIKDYLHLYLGCEVHLKGCAGRYQLEGVHKDKGIIRGFNMRFNQYIAIKNIKPILRPLSDMTKEEFNEVKKIVPYYDLTAFTDGRYHYYEHAEVNNYESRRVCETDAGIGSFPLEAAPYLFSKHFDLFKLHEQRVCLYKSDL